MRKFLELPLLIVGLVAFFIYAFWPKSKISEKGL